MPNHVWNKIVVENICDLPIFNTKIDAYFNPGTQLDFNTILPEPEDLEDVTSGSYEDRAIGWLLNRMFESEAMRYSRDIIRAEKLFEFMKTIRDPAEKPKDLEKYILNIIRTGEPSWYYWRRRHWGTKWNAYETKIIDKDTIAFKTAWNPVPKIIETMMVKFRIPKIDYSWVSEEYSENGRSIYHFGGPITHCMLPLDEHGVPYLFEELFGYKAYDDEEE